MPLWLLSALILLYSCTDNKLNQAIISGTITGETGIAKLELNKVENGELSLVTSTNLHGGKSFGFLTDVKEPGIYVITLIDANGRKLLSDHSLNRFYLTNQEHIEIELTESTYKLVSTNLNENKILSEWNAKIDTLFTYAYPFQCATTYKEFFPLLPQYISMAEEFKIYINTRNTTFDKLMNYLVDTDLATAALLYVYTPHQKHPANEDFTPYYHKLIKTDFFNDASVLNIPTGKTLLNLQPKFWYRMEHGAPPKGRIHKYFGMLRKHISNDTLKGYMALDELKFFKCYDESFIDFKNEVKPYLLNRFLKEEFTQHELSIRTFGIGAQGFNFKGNDSDGKEYRLSDFKGKLVYVDVWATWCGPCKKEIPELQKLEKEYHGKDIVFISYSIDEPKNKEQWKAYVKDNQLGGIQLTGDKGFRSNLAEAYGITSIPRFLLFDKAGKVISTDAPRPSNKELKELLNKNL